MKKVLQPTEIANSNTLQKEDSSVHEWYRFVLSFPPHLVQKYLKAFKCKPQEDIVFDPFCGTGTTLVEAKKLGFKAYGCDAHPFAALVSRTKTNWEIDPAEIKEASLRLMRRIENKGQKVFGSEGERYVNGYRLTEHEETLLPTGFVSPRILLKLLITRDEIFSSKVSEELQGFFLVALAHTIANGAGNFAFGPEIYRTKEKADYGVFEHFSRQVQQMVNDLEHVKRDLSPFQETKVFYDDARVLEHVPKGISAVITSPPYPNEKDYTRTTRVEALLLKLFSDKAGLRKVKESLLRSNTRNIFVKDSDGIHVKEFDSIQSICQQIEQRRIDLNKTSGFEKLYHKVVAHYFGGMRLHLRALKPKLNKGAKLGYVVGDQMSFLMVMVPTAQLLAEVAEAEGYKVIGCDLWRERVGTKVRNCPDKQKTVRVREEVLLLQKPK